MQPPCHLGPGRTTWSPPACGPVDKELQTSLRRRSRRFWDGSRSSGTWGRTGRKTAHSLWWTKRPGQPSGRSTPHWAQVCRPGTHGQRAWGIHGCHSWSHLRCRPCLCALETPVCLSSMSPRGLTESLLHNSEERRGKLRLDENTVSQIKHLFQLHHLF